MKPIRSLQILRALSAITVVVAHAVVMANVWSPLSQATLASTEEFGRIAVYVFFVISGVIISYVNYDEFDRPGAMGRFLLKRFIRVVPIYWIATILEFAWRSVRHATPSFADLGYSMLFIPATRDGHGLEPLRPILGVGWTLNYEVLFYVLFAFCLPMARSRGLAVVLAVLAAVVAAGAVFVKPVLDTSEPTTTLEFWTDPILLMFASGVVIGAIARAGVRRGHYDLMHGLAVLVIAALAFALLAPATPASALWRCLFAAVAIFAVWSAVLEDRAYSSPVYRFFEKIGDASYSIYLFHFFALAGIEKMWWWSVGREGVFDFIILASIAATAIGVMAHYAVEKPVIAALNDLLRKRRSRVSALPAGSSPTIGVER